MIIIARLMPTLPAAIKILERAEATGRKFLLEKFGNEAFAAGGGNVLWGQLATRPYIRTARILAGFTYENKQYDVTLRIGTDLLRISPEDGFGQHVTLGSLLARMGRHADSLSFCQKWFNPDVPPDGGGISFTPPRSELFSIMDKDAIFASRHEEYWIQGAVVHTAAYSAFKLWGDCTESRQYLELGSRINPLILFKILGRIAIPKRPSSDVRINNGAEDAKSYLWRMQDLWMEPDVWNWVDNNPNVKGTALRICSGCETVEPSVATFKRCADCHLVSYCNSECQRADWPSHKQLAARI
ncbi:hypothetical protein C8J57DRAFT_761526 [Mycena rebaudengoi]|nr:hypothetical protein C8J57DRAFT_761526 [Mycena rebaudengoi]